MHVGLNLVYLVPGETGGTETYARQLIPALLRGRPELRLTAFVNREAAAVSGPWSDLVPSVTVPVRARSRSQWVRGEQQLLPGLAHRAGCELVHSLANTAPVWGRFKRVVTIHDLIHLRFPETHGLLLGRGMRLLVGLAARRSDRILVPTAHVRDDVARSLGIPAEKLDVSPLGPGSESTEPVPEDELRIGHSLGSRPIAVTVAAKRRHKNLLRLIEALALIPAPRRPVLVLIGYPTPYERELRERVDVLELGADTRFIDLVSRAELEGFYRAAACVVLPSLDEGFGLPLLEAMARGVPVACSDRGSLVEVAGGAARIFDPERPQAIAQAIEAILGDPAEADRLRAAGRRRAAEFTWEETARRTVLSYERALSGRSSVGAGSR